MITLLVSLKCLKTIFTARFLFRRQLWVLLSLDMVFALEHVFMCGTERCCSKDVWLLIKPRFLPPSDPNMTPATWLQMLTVTLERKAYPRSLNLMAAMWNLAQLIKHWYSKPKILKCNPKWVHFALPFLSSMLADLFFRVPTLPQIKCFFWSIIYRGIHSMQAASIPITNLLGL